MSVSPKDHPPSLLCMRHDLPQRYPRPHSSPVQSFKCTSSQASTFSAARFQACPSIPYIRSPLPKTQNIPPHHIISPLRIRLHLSHSFTPHFHSTPPSHQPLHCPPHFRPSPPFIWLTNSSTSTFTTCSPGTTIRPRYRLSISLITFFVQLSFSLPIATAPVDPVDGSILGGGGIRYSKAWARTMF